MEAAGFSAQVVMLGIKREFKYKGYVVLTVDISYPKLILKSNPRVEEHINSIYRAQALGFYRHASLTLYPDAVREYIYSIKNNFPVRVFDAVMRYEVTLNQDCYFSSYSDRYEYTGGAHGNTIRASDTFDLKTGKRLMLSDLFKPGEDYRRLLIEQIILQADYNISQNPGIYFEDYRALIVKNFNQKSFYLTPSGVDVYYQQYEIAPYATGIVVFEVSYNDLGISRPGCI